MFFLLRILIRTLVAVTLLTAAFQGLGRVGMHYLQDLEPRINQAIAGAGVRLVGLRGSWQRFNPVFEVSQLKFVGGSAENLYLEIDIVESLYRNRIVAANLRSTDLAVAVTRDKQGRLVLLGQVAKEPPIDIAAFLKHSDEIFIEKASVYPVSADQGASAAMEGEAIVVSVLLQNTDAHRGHLVASTGPDNENLVSAGKHCNACNLNVHYEIFSHAWFGGENEALAGIVQVEADALRIAPALGALWGVSGQVNHFSGQIILSEDGGLGHMELALGGVQFPSGELEALDLEARVSLSENLGNYKIAIPEIRAKQNDVLAQELSLSFVTDSNAPYLVLDVSRTNLANVANFGASATSNNELLSGWLNGLNMRGSVNNLGLKYEFQNRKLLYFADFEHLGMDAYKGVPLASNLSGELSASNTSVELHLDTRDAELGFDKVFAEPLILDRVVGSLLLTFPEGYLGIIGYDLELSLGETTLMGGFALTKPKNIHDQQLSIAADIENIGIESAKQFLPKTLKEDVKVWLENSILNGEIASGSFAYHGDTKRRENMPPKKFVMHLNLLDVQIKYHPDWPLVENINGELYLTQSHIEAFLESAATLGLNMRDLDVILPANADFVDLKGTAGGDFGSAIAFVRQSPLTESLDFIDQSWAARGGLNFDLEARIPIKSERVGVNVDMLIALNDAALDMPDIGLSVDKLVGSAEFTYPATINSPDFTGRLFDRNATFAFSTLNDVIHISSQGRASVDDVSEWLEFDHGGLVAGEFEYSSRLNIYPESQRPSSLDVFSELKGVSVELPSELNKSAEQSWDMQATVEFGEPSVLIEIDLPNRAKGWWQFENSLLQRGSLGIGVPALHSDNIGDEFVVTGYLSLLNYSLGSELSNESITFPWAFHDLHLGSLKLDDFEFGDLLVQGRGRKEFQEFSVNSESLIAKYRQQANLPPKLYIESVIIPDRADSTDIVDPLTGFLPDPLADFDPNLLTDVDVVIDQIFLGDEAYGAWSFDIRNTENGIEFHNLTSLVKGISIRSENGVVWRDGNTYFNGAASGVDMADILPQWDYSPNIRSESLQINADVSWVGSPLNFELEYLRGLGDFEIKNGEFVDLEGATGPLRIFTLMNFSAVAKRLSGNFSDVFGKGIEFDKVKATVNFDEGLVTFVEPMSVKGSSGTFEVQGLVDLNQSLLDNTMIVTLPVTKSLPWYAAWAAIANPLAGIGILVGGKLIEKPLEAFSSARYKISGSMDDPKVVFDSIFTTSMDSPQSTGSRVSTDIEPETGTDTEINNQMSPNSDGGEKGRSEEVINDKFKASKSDIEAAI